MTSPTQRTKTMLTCDGWTAAVVERWNPHARIRQDLFGFADILAIKPNHTPQLIQVTSGSNLSSRKSKILDLPVAAQCIRSGFRIVLHGWRKVKVKRGGKAKIWQPRIVELQEDDFPCLLEPCAT